MLGQSVQCFFDFVDPASWIMVHNVEQIGRFHDVEWVGLEVRPPPLDPIDPESGDWAEYHNQIAQYGEALGISIGRPNLVPWTRKAHELFKFAMDKDCSKPALDTLFQAHFVHGQDIGRVDVLVELAVAIGLDRSETKAVLDVDSYTQHVESDRALAETLGIVGVPIFFHDNKRLEGLSSPDDLAEWFPQD